MVSFLEKILLPELTAVALLEPLFVHLPVTSSVGLLKLIFVIFKPLSQVKFR